MIVSAKGRYALRVMVHFAQRGGGEFIPLKEIAESEGISQKYLESIMTTLSKAGFVDAVHGKGGGYRLNGGGLKRRLLYHPGSHRLLPHPVLPDQAHVGASGQDD